MAIAHIVSTGAQADATSVTTPAVDTTGANLIVVTGARYTGSAAATPFTDSKGNAWTLAVAEVQTTGGGGFVTQFKCENPTSVGTGHTFTFTLTDAISYPSIGVSAFSGALLSSALDQSTSGTDNASPYNSPLTGTLAQADEVAVGSYTDNGAQAQAITQGAGWSLGYVADGTSVFQGIGHAYKILASTAAVESYFETTVAQFSANIVATYKATAVGGVTGTSSVTTAGVTGSATGLLTQIAVPVSDGTVGAWLSTGANLWSVIDEWPANDADYIHTETLSSSSRIKLATLTDPNSSSNHILQYRIRGNGVNTVDVKLYTGGSTTVGSGTLVRTYSHAALSATLTDFSQTLSGGEADAITDYANLYLEFSAT